MSIKEFYFTIHYNAYIKCAEIEENVNRKDGERLLYISTMNNSAHLDPVQRQKFRIHAASPSPLLRWKNLRLYFVSQVFN